MKEIPVGKGLSAIVDDEIYAHLRKWRWFAQYGSRSKEPYAKRTIMLNGKTFTLFMHHAVIGRIVSDNFQVDHINRNTLDNRLVNLRFVSQSQNILNSGIRRDNSTGYRGVVKSRNGKFEAQMKFKGKHYCLGTYPTAIEASEVYSRFRTKMINSKRPAEENRE